MKLLHADADAGRLTLFTRYVMVLWVVHYMLHPFEQVTMLPLLALDPTGLIALLPVDWLAWLFDGRVLFGMRIAILALCMAGLQTSLFRWVGLPLCLLITFELSLVRSFGHVSHAEVPLLLVTMILAVFCALDGGPSRDGVETANPQTRWATPLVLSAFVFCVTYSLVGVVRITTDPLSIFTSDTMLWSIAKHSSRPWLIDFDGWQWVARWPWLLPPINVGFAVVTIFELLAPLALLSRGFRRAFVLVIAGFHLSVLVLMELPFLHHLALLPLLVDPRAQRAASTRGGGSARKRA